MGLRWPSLSSILAAICLLLCVGSPAPLRSEISHFEQGNLYLEQRRLEAAIQELLLALEEGVVEARTFNNLGYAHYLKQETQQAVKYYLKALELQPTSELILNNLGSAYQQQKEYSKAEELYRKALQVNPKHVKAAYNLAGVLYRQKRYVLAARQYLKAKKLNREYGNKRFSKERVVDSISQDLQKDPANQELQRALKILKKQ